MIRAFLAVALLGSACAAAADDEETYIVELRDGRVYHGFIQYQDDNIIRLELDAPWERRSVRTFRKDAIADIAPEWSVERERRIRRGWEERGRIQVQTGRGLRWLRREDALLAQRAREMKVDLLEQPPPAVAMGPLDVASDEALDEDLRDLAEEEERPTAADATPGFWSEWGLHMGIGAAGLLLLALIIRGLILA